MAEMGNWAIAFNIVIPRLRTYLFFLPQKLATTVFTPDEFRKIFACVHPSATKEIGDVCTQAIKYGSYP